MKKHIHIAILGMLCSTSAFAQFNLGVATSDYSVMNSMYMNPANIADCREKIVINIIGINAGLENNLGRLTSLGGLNTALKSGNTDNIFNYTNSSTFSLLAPFAEVKGPGLMINIDNKNSLAFTTGVRGFNQFNNFDQSLFRTISDPNYTYQGSTTGNVDLTSRNFNYTAQLWSQIGLTYARVLLDQGEHKLRAGVTLRYLGGIGYVGLKGNNLDAHYRSGNDSLYVTNSDVEFASNVLSTKNALVNGFSNSDLLSTIFGAKEGHGVGGDIGVVYDYIPENMAGDGRYKLRLSASVTDIGHITYSASNNFNANISGNGNITANGLSNVSTFDEFRAYAKAQGFKADTLSQASKVYLPTALILGGDYNIISKLYVNATIMGNLANRQNFGNSYYGFVSVTPRYDTRMYSVSLPITYSVLAHNMEVGLGLRVSGFYIGSQDMLALFSKNQFGFNIYAGGYVPLFKKRTAQRHNTGRSLDTTDFNAEPDMEHGGATDTTSDCPDLFEAVDDSPVRMAPVAQTEKDTDGDGIPDSRDACPTVAGPASNNGCPLPKDKPKKTVNFSNTTIQFEKGTTISKDAYTTLDEAAQTLKEYPSYHMMVCGYTDNKGTASENLALSKARAEQVKKYITGKGISSDRVQTNGLGDSQPIADNSTADGRAKNRRVVLMLKKN